MRLLYTMILLSVFGLVESQPYYNMSIPNKFVSENAFLTKTIDTSALPIFANIKYKLPQPYWPSRPDALRCYWFAWEIAFRNTLKPIPQSGFVSPFIDAAFNGNLFMWDSGFMLMFGRYGIQAFNFQQTLNNFYAKQHSDGFICREIKEKDGTDLFHKNDPSSTGPNILPWCEWEYFLNYNDTLRLKEVFPPLLAYYQWFHTNRTWPDGSYFSSGWGCGMDNQPRVPGGEIEAVAWWDNGHMSWIDITLQEIFAAKILIKIAAVINRTNDVADIVNEVDTLTNYVNQKMWDDQTSFYYDRFSDGKLSSTKSIASFWALLAEVVPAHRLNNFIMHLENKNEFARKHRVATLSADNPLFNPDGGYWQGSIWAPTNYMVLRGLTNNKKDSLAFEIALNHYNNVIEVFNATGTLWENYAPDKVHGNNRKDFVGWTGLVPIAVLFEYIFGLRPDVPNNTLVWDIRLIDEFGVDNYPFGKNGKLSVHVKKRTDAKQMPDIKIKSNIIFNLKLIWAGGSKVMIIKKTS